MALQELSPLPRITGPEMLGAAVSNTSERYANTARQDQLLDRARTNQLADVASARDYEDQRYDRARADQLTDEDRRTMRAVAGALVAERLLSPDQMNNPEAIATAYQEAVRRGLDKVYEELTSTPGPDGKPLLMIADFENPERIAQAKAQLGEIRAQQNQLAMAQTGLQQDDFTRLREEERKIQQQIQALTDDLQRGADYVPTEAEVSNVALALAQSLKKPGERPSRAEIDSQRAAAIQQLREVGMQNQYLDRQTKAVQLQALTQQLSAIKANTQAYIQRGVGPRQLAEPTAAPASAPTGAAPTTGTPMQSFMQMLEQEAAGRTPPAATSPQAVLTAEPSTAPSAPPPIYTPTPSTGRAVTQRRANEAIGDTMRGLGYGIGNLFRPSSWREDASGDAVYLDVDPEVLLPQLRSRLAAMSDQNSAAAAELKNAIYELTLRQEGPPRELPSPQRVQAAAPGQRMELLNLPSAVPASAGRPITSAPSLFPTPTNWWSGGK